MGKYIVTGGAGFIGSHVVDRLLEQDHQVCVIDDFSSGKQQNLSRWQSSNDLVIRKERLEALDSLPAPFMDSKAVFHLAALSSVRVGLDNPDAQWKNNVVATYHLLKLMKEAEIPYLLFSSSSVVYGDPKTLPTPENHPLEPISLYGATKVAGESLIAGFAHMFDMRALSFRFANILGPRLNHGVVYDFIHKLLDSPAKLEILGDGTQNKSYLYVDDLLDAMFTAYHAFQNDTTPYDVYNVGNEGRTTVMQIAEIVAEEMDLSPTFHTTGGVEGGRGWKGDVKEMLLDISKIGELGWQPSYSSDEAVRRAAKALIEEITES